MKDIQDNQVLAMEEGLFFGHAGNNSALKVFQMLLLNRKEEVELH
jgi:hypothetical protein